LDSKLFPARRGAEEEALQKKYLVELTPEDRAELEGSIRGGTASVRKVKRASVLLAADEGEKDEVVAGKARVSRGTVERIRQRFFEEGLQAALSERPRPGKPPKLDGRQEAHVLWPAASRPRAMSDGHSGSWPIVWWSLKSWTKSATTRLGAC
jgi:transposase